MLYEVLDLLIHGPRMTTLAIIHSRFWQGLLIEANGLKVVGDAPFERRLVAVPLVPHAIPPHIHRIKHAQLAVGLVVIRV